LFIVGIGAGPFGAPVRYTGPTNGVRGGWERPISTSRTVFSFVAQVKQSGIAWKHYNKFDY